MSALSGDGLRAGAAVQTSPPKHQPSRRSHTRAVAVAVTSTTPQKVPSVRRSGHRGDDEENDAYSTIGGAR